MTEAIDVAVALPPRDDVQDAISAVLFVHGLLNRVEVEVIDGDRYEGRQLTEEEEVAATYLRLTPHDGEAREDIRVVFGLDDIRDEGDPCPHKKETASEDGTWVCEECGETRTAEALDRLIGTIQDALTKASRHPAGSALQAAGVREAGIWMRHADRTATYILSRTRVGYPSDV